MKPKIGEHLADIRRMAEALNNKGHNIPIRQLMSMSAQALGRLGGQTKSKAKARASRANGKLGGRPARTKEQARAAALERWERARLIKRLESLGWRDFDIADTDSKFGYWKKGDLTARRRGMSSWEKVPENYKLGARPRKEKV